MKIGFSKQHLWKSVKVGHQRNQSSLEMLNFVTKETSRKTKKTKKNQRIWRDGRWCVFICRHDMFTPISRKTLVFLVFLDFLEVSLVTNFNISSELWFLWWPTLADFQRSVFWLYQIVKSWDFDPPGLITMEGYQWNKLCSNKSMDVDKKK